MNVPNLGVIIAWILVGAFGLVAALLLVAALGGIMLAEWIAKKTRCWHRRRHHHDDWGGDL